MGSRHSRCCKNVCSQSINYHVISRAPPCKGLGDGLCGLGSLGYAGLGGNGGLGYAGLGGYGGLGYAGCGAGLGGYGGLGYAGCGSGFGGSINQPINNQVIIPAPPCAVPCAAPIAAPFGGLGYGLGGFESLGNDLAELSLLTNILNISHKI